MAAWRPLDQYAPFARILVQHMWEARPPINPNQLATRAGVRRQLLSQWLNAPATADLRPDPAAVVKVARVMSMPVADLLIKAGHATPSDPLFDRTGAWGYVIQCVEGSPSFAQGIEREGKEQDELWNEATRQHVVAFLRAIEAEDAAAHQVALSATRQPRAVQNEEPHDLSIEIQDIAESDAATSN